ncbi:hypothetical protein ACQEU5_05015 [Marinactinospora thermotolerans]|uniref:Uncharacterized protein n=1 Tax=Marinactinospora thermotolerans DSM 45154 TaxID=1122192 RepID=A0A1T4QLA6_9ACTN|nr:hypothetical protein [Marinactinospora thermotolerans]SKA04494.1 hypothetical protein SAMN02745673_02296 [Marinactinospora thermotolerans DSM 45154]
MNNEAIQRLREPAAWALLGAVGVRMLGGLIYLFGAHASEYGPSSIPANFVARGELFFGPVTVALLLAAVALAVLPSGRSRAFPVVLASLIMAGLGLLVGLITLIMSFVASAGYSMAISFSDFFVTLAHLAILGVAAFVLLKVFGDRTLVPRSSASVGPYGQQQPFAPHTGAQQSFAPPADPAAQTGTGFPQAGAHAAYGHTYGEPAQTGWPQPQGEGYAQPSGGQPAYQAQPDPSASYDQSAYQGQAGYSSTGGQDSAREWNAQQGYGDYQQQSYGQEWQQGAHQQGNAYGQQSYAQAEQPPYAAQPGYTDSGAQSGYGSYGQQPAAPYGTGGQQSYGASEYESGQAHAGGEQHSYSGQQPGYPSDAEATMIQPPVTPGNDPAQGGEQAAQDAIQYGWYQQTPAAETPQQDQSDSESTMRVEPGYSGQYGTGGYTANPHETTSPYGENYSSEQRRSSTEGEDRQQGWYRDDDRR